jgi:hypothetical protein
MINDRRLEINPEPLKVVTARPGSPASRTPPLALAIRRAATLRNGTHVRRVSVHQEGCPRLPSTESTGWTVAAATQDMIARTLDEADQADVPVAVSCRTCGGWTTVR